MGRPEEPLERDGSPEHEFAYWLRDLRRSSGLTYHSLAQSTHYAPSTVQAAAAGRRLPSLKVTMAFVAACGGDADDWRAYWSQVKRVTDPYAPDGGGPTVEPPWMTRVRPAPEAPLLLGGDNPLAAAVTAPDGWYVESFSSVLRMDKPSPEAVEHRVIVAVTSGISELATSVSVPRHPDDPAAAHALEAELEFGGSLELRDQPSESYFRNFITLPRPLNAGDRHEYQLRLRVPAGQAMAPHYAYVPFCRSDYFELRARFSPDRLPSAIYVLCGTPTAVIYERDATQRRVTPDRFGEVHVEFRNLQQGRAYGVRWQD
jgi:hypothetical protein